MRKAACSRTALRALRALAAAWSLMAMPAASAQEVHLVLEPRDGWIEAWADNRLAGPVEVRLRSGHGRVVGEPALPARATVDAGDRVLVARVRRTASGVSGPLDVVLDAVPGRVNARPRDIEYRFPLQTRDVRIEQAWGGPWSHADAENRYAVDFAAPPGTPVLAAREGRVMQVVDGASVDAAHAALVRVLHDDGSMAVYAHLAPGAIDVRAGDRVRLGQRLGLSGDSGRSSGPHLHFAVQANHGMRLDAIPFRMFGPPGILRFFEPHSSP